MATWKQIMDTACPECGSESERCINPDGSKPILAFHLARTDKAKEDSARRDRVWASVWGGDVATWKQILGTACPTCYVHSGHCMFLKSSAGTFHQVRKAKADVRARVIKARRERIVRFLKTIADTIGSFRG